MIYEILGMVAAVITLGTPLFYGSKRYIQPYFFPEVLQNQFLSATTRWWEPGRARALARVAIVDDNPRDFPVAELRSSGYQIEVFKQVKLSDMDKLSEFDVVFLDIKGVVKDDPERGGLKLIKSLRDKSSLQKICAVSSQTFDPTAADFFLLADDRKKKPVTARECKEVIDKFLSDLYSPDAVSETVKACLSALPAYSKTKVKKYLSEKSEEGPGRRRFTKKIRRLGVGVDEAEALWRFKRIVFLYQDECR